MAIKVKALTLPAAGVDTVDITIVETYDVRGVGKDTVELKGVLVANRGAPLLEHGTKTADWETATVVAQFTSLKLSGNSELFGPVKVTLDKSGPSFGVVRAGKCKASIAIVVAMPKLGMTLRTLEPVQLQSTVTTVPPIGDERTESVKPVKLIDVKTNKTVGSIDKARVMWRDLTVQTPHAFGKFI